MQFAIDIFPRPKYVAIVENTDISFLAVDFGYDVKLGNNPKQLIS